MEQGDAAILSRDTTTILEKCGPCLFLEDRTVEEGFITIIAESFRPAYPIIRPTLAVLAEPISRPSLIHEYRLTPFSLGAAVSSGVTPQEALLFLTRHSYGVTSSSHGKDAPDGSLHTAMANFIESCMGRYNLARVIIEEERTVVQCKDLPTAQMLLDDAVIRSLAAAPYEIRFEVSRWRDDVQAFPFFLLQSRAASKDVAARCVVLGLPIQQQYDYEKDPSIRTANITLRSQTRPRRYQVEAVEAATGDGTLKSGCLLLPCGAGKTLLGIMLLCKVKKPTLVVCAGGVSVEQWKNQILEYASLDPPEEPHPSSAAAAGGKQRQPRVGAARIACLTGKQKDEIDDETDVVLTTYSMLVSAHRQHARKQAQKVAETRRTADPLAYTERGTRKRTVNPKEKIFSSYGLLILDEVHVIPAEAFSESLSFIDAKGVVGLTATYVREDRKINHLFHLVGPKLYDVSMESLVAQGYLARVHCVEVHTPMTREFGLEYMERSAQVAHRQKTGKMPVLVMLAAANPNKMLCVRELIQRHLEGGAKILVFCDHIMLLEEYGKFLHAPVICGKTQHKERLMIFSDFQSTSKVNVVCISRVGDVSVNLPNANVVIQVSSHGGSRRQEAQRLGRILRPKEKAANGKTVDAWFYSIISMDTLEMAYAAHRTAFLVDQGYACRLMQFSPNLSRQAAGCGAPLKKYKDDPVGDTASIKQESLNTTLRNTRVLGRTQPGHAVFAETQTLPYQLNLLSKVVSSWEIEYQKESSRRRGNVTARASDASESSSSDDDVEQVQPERDFLSIKREFGDYAGGHVEGTTVGLNDLVGVDDGFVYHEL